MIVQLDLPFQATVRGVDQAGDRFRIDTVPDNFSATGLYLRLARPIESGATLFVVVRFVIAPAPILAAPGVAACGVVVWAEPRPGGAWGVAVKFTHQRFLYTAASSYRVDRTSATGERARVRPGHPTASAATASQQAAQRGGARWEPIG